LFLPTEEGISSILISSPLILELAFLSLPLRKEFLHLISSPLRGEDESGG